MPFLAFETINKVSRSCKIPFGRKFRRDGSTPSPAAVQMVIFLEKHPSLRFQRMYHKVFLLLPSVLCGVLLSTPSGSRLGRNKVDADLVFLIVLPVQAAPWRLRLARFDRARSEISENQWFSGKIMIFSHNHWFRTTVYLLTGRKLPWDAKFVDRQSSYRVFPNCISWADEPSWGTWRLDTPIHTNTFFTAAGRQTSLNS